VQVKGQFGPEFDVQTVSGGATVTPRAHSPVVTKDPAAVAAEVRSAYNAILPAGDKGFVSRAFGWAEEYFNGRYQDYLPVDVPYHDFEHTLQGTLCMSRILRGWHEAGAQPPLTQEVVELGLLAILLHDTGYLKHQDDTEGTGAKYTITHVRRSGEFAARFLEEKGYRPDQIRAVQNMIQCTGLDASIGEIPFQSELERIAGHALGTADLLGQMAAKDYVDKLPELYREFTEAARHEKGKAHFVSTYSGPEDLMRRTPGFWDTFVRPKLERDFGAIYRFLNHPYPDGPNFYLERIRSNMDRLRDQ